MNPLNTIKKMNDNEMLLLLLAAKAGFEGKNLASLVEEHAHSKDKRWFNASQEAEFKLEIDNLFEQSKAMRVNDNAADRLGCIYEAASESIGVYGHTSEIGSIHVLEVFDRNDSDLSGEIYSIVVSDNEEKSLSKEGRAYSVLGANELKEVYYVPVSEPKLLIDKTFIKEIKDFVAEAGGDDVADVLCEISNFECEYIGENQWLVNGGNDGEDEVSVHIISNILSGNSDQERADKMNIVHKAIRMGNSEDDNTEVDSDDDNGLSM